jgi:asparagine synthase (glutamine-hydrolysing)
MCGIAGLIGGCDGGDPARLAAGMLADLRHRGPDGEGMFIDGDFALGHRRLAIVDLSDAGGQPMTSRDGRWTVSLNGEIFNYLELREQLGGEFRGASDTEVLLEACAAWGVEKTLERSNGMFAFALWDARDRELTLARDRVGEKPLVYFSNASTFAFSSEMKALRRLSDRRLDPAAVDAYLALGYVPAPLAIFRDCRKLPAGHLLRYRDGRIAVRRWWFPENAAREPHRDAATHVRELVRDAVRLRLRADVPMALFLSGGVDSSIVAAECSRLGARPAAFTAAFDGDHTDAVHARRVARHLGLPHEVLEVSGRTITDEIENILGAYDEPFADSSALPSFALARELAGRYKVVLDGEGGDEAFGGYRHYQRIQAKQAVKAAAAATGLCDGARGGPLQLYVQSKALFRSADRAGLANGHGAAGDALTALLASDEFLQCATGGALKRALWSDRHLYLPNDLTYKMDIALAAHGMEGRAPFLDYRVLEWAQGLDDRELVRGGEKKVLLRAAYRGDLPDQVLDRPKLGFGAPMGKWLAGPLRQFVRDVTPCPLLDGERQRRLTGHRLSGHRQWALVAFSSWARRWRASW